MYKYNLRANNIHFNLSFIDFLFVHMFYFKFYKMLLMSYPNYKRMNIFYFIHNKLNMYVLNIYWKMY